VALKFGSSFRLPRCCLGEGQTLPYMACSLRKEQNSPVRCIIPVSHLRTNHIVSFSALLSFIVIGTWTWTWERRNEAKGDAVL